MNDQQSPSASDPQDSPPSNPDTRTHPRSALSDKEAFSLLAESMADRTIARSTNGAFASNGLNGDKHDGSPRAEAANGGNHVSVRHLGDMPPVVPFRPVPINLSEVEAAADNGGRDDRPADLLDSPAKNRRRFDWSTPVLIEEHWDLSGDQDSDLIHGQVTEVIDPKQISPIFITAASSNGGGVVGSDLDAIEPSPNESVATKGEPDAARRILPPLEESHHVDPLPPLVFLDTRGDILPRIGETPPDRNRDTLEPEVDVRDGGGPLAEPTTSASGVENMADPRGDIEEAAGVGRPPGADAATGTFPDQLPLPPVDTPDPLDGLGELDGSGVGDAGDTQAPSSPPSLDLQAAPAQPIAAFADPPAAPAESAESGSFHASDNPAAVPVDESEDARIEELQRIFDQYSGPVIAVIASIAGERHAIDEALQSTFEAVWKTVDTFDPDQPRGPWMFTLARRQAAEQIEVARRLDQESKPGGYPVPSHRHDEAIAVDKSWEAWEVRLAVDQLSPAEHDVLRLIHNGGLIHPEIAAQLHTTVGAVKSHAYGGSHRLVELLDHVIRPDATEGLSVDQASALTWYLAGVADGSDLDAEERSAVKRVQAQLASATAWIVPDSHARERVVMFARRTLNDPGPLAGSGAGVDVHGLAQGVAHGATRTGDSMSPESPGRYDVTGDDDTSNRRPMVVAAVCVVGLIAVIGAWSLLTGPGGAQSEQVRRYEMQPTGTDADATGVVEVATVSTGSRYQLEFGGLDATTPEDFYAVWLQSTAGGGVVPLGTFSWQASGDPLVLSGPEWSDDYDLLVVTRSRTMSRASIDDPTVLSVSIE